MSKYIKKNIFLYLITGIFLMIPVCSFSQFNLFRNFNVKDGLPSSEVYEMLQESSGYFWFGTDMGVSRYNGYEFKNYTTEDGLPDNTVFGIYEDHKHNIWFRTLSGRLAYFNNNKICAIPANDTLAKILQKRSILSIYVDSKDTIWLGINSKFYLKISPGWGKQNVQIIDIPNAGGYIFEIENKFIYGGSSPEEPNIFLYKKDREVFKVNTYFKNTFGFGSNYRYYVTRLSNNSYLASIDNLQINFDSTGIIKKWEDDAVSICEIEDIDKSILVGTFNGLKILNPKSDELSDLTKKFERKIITALHRDSENELWICTKGHGIFYIPYRNFKYYTNVNGLSESSISVIGVLGDEVISGHLSGEICFLKKNSVNTIRLLYQDYYIGQPNEVTSILDYTTDKKYIGTIGNLYEFSTKTKNIVLVKSMALKKILKSNDGNILSIQGRMLMENIPSKNFKGLFSIPLPYYSDNLFQDKSGKIWICTSNGLLTYTHKAGLQNLGEKENKLLLARMVDVKQDKNGAIWMVSRGEGVIIKDGNKLSQIKQENGLSSNMCRTIFMDSTNVIWVGTNNGLNKITINSYNPLKYIIDTYYSENGLLTNEVNHIIKYNNKLWLTHNDGISVVDPKNIKNNKTPPPVYITEVLINGENAFAKNLNNLKYSDNYLIIKYNGLSYKEPGNIEYKYKMEGMDTSWIHTKYTSLTFNTIQPGTYRFLIYAKNNDGYWSKYPATFSFTIASPWWKTWIFIAFIILVFGLLVGFAFRYGLNIIERRERLKTIHQTRLSNAELKALRAQMNPHFVFNAINSVQYFITGNDPISSQKYLSKFAKLIRYVVDNSKPAAIPLIKELEALNLYLDLESLRFENKFEYKIDVSNNVDIDNIKIPSMLIQPFVENAIWHGLMHKESKGKINVSIDIKDQVLICIIEDNGVGRKKSREIVKEKNNDFHKSVGMSITQERLDILNQINNSNLTMTIIDLEDSNGNGIGTRVELNLPFY
jgi:ligand-binding sensor domain-containing protein